MKHVSHQYVVQYIDGYEDLDYLYLVLEYVDGGDLLDFITSKRGLGRSHCRAAKIQPADDAIV